MGEEEDQIGNERQEEGGCDGENVKEERGKEKEETTSSR